MAELSPEAIAGYHAHIYYDAARRDFAATLRLRIGELFEVRLGRMHDAPVGPHPVAMYQVAFAPDQYADFIPWLMLNRGGLTVFLHPETGDELADHTDHAIWMGAMLELDTSVLEHDPHG